MSRTRLMGIVSIALCVGAAPIFPEDSNHARAGGAAGPASANASPLPVVTLDEALAAAEANGPNLRVARYALAIARAQLGQAKAKAAVSLSGSGAYYHEETLPGAVSNASYGSAGAAQSAIEAGSASPVGENFEAALTLAGPLTSLSLSAQHLIEEGSLHDQVSSFRLSGSQTLYDGFPGGRGAATLKEAEYSYHGAEVAFASSSLTIAFQVKQAYYALLGDQEAIAVQEANVKQAEEDLARVEGFLEAGQATRLDVLQAQVALRQTRLSQRSANNQVTIDRKNPSLLAGWPLDRLYGAAEVPAPTPRSTDEAEALKIALENRAELKQLALDIASGGVALALSKSQYLPVVSATGSLSLNKDWTTGYSSGSYALGVSISLPIFENGLLDAQVKQAEAQLESVQLQQEQERRSIMIAVQSALAAVEQDRNGLEVARQSTAAALGQYELEKAKFAAGLATNLDVLQASSALMSAESSLELAKNAYGLAVLSLNNTLGL